MRYHAESVGSPLMTLTASPPPNSPIPRYNPTSHHSAVLLKPFGSLKMAKNIAPYRKPTNTPTATDPRVGITPIYLRQAHATPYVSPIAWPNHNEPEVRPAVKDEFRDLLPPLPCPHHRLWFT